jgi:cytochrome c peroxidase
MKKAFSCLAVLAWGGTALAAAPPAAPKLPLGVSAALYEISVPLERRPTPQQIALGTKLFNDKRLSADDSVSCATCHDPKRAFTDGEVRSEGIQKQVGQRNSPTVLNALFNATQFWDGRAGTLEEQALLPIINPIEMGMPDLKAVVAKLQGLPEYANDFQQVFGGEVTAERLGQAIAAFERTQYSGNARFDRFLTGDSKALNDSERRGWALFNGKGRCNSCHAGNAVSPLFSDQKFHNIGIAAHQHDFTQLANQALRVVRTGDAKQIDELALQSNLSQMGRFLVTKNENDVGSFKTPTLRNVGVTGPYMHDGSLATLWDVMDHYNKGGIPNPYLDGGMQRLGLTEPEIDDLVAFLFTLTSDDFASLEKKELAAQRARKAKRPERDTAAALGKKGDLGDIGVSPDVKISNPAARGFYGPVGQSEQ